ncbi:tetratricopeptide repeat protein [Polaribacter batillariae]|uniref:Tetratricopeptide repeat protein n=2 Tax=Polaribacter batillariae TaxID=2808900 RepID=A0ABX7SYM1_9FLAO|nr:tetratricopeptide repeat protein [Polaribacter batillariae]
MLSQQTIANTSILKDYNNALKLYNNKAYAAAQKTFDKVIKKANIGSNLKTDATYFEAMCAIKLNQTGADKKVLSFVEEYPNSNKKNVAFFNVGNYYFANKKAAYALKWYQKVDPKMLSKEDKKELDFKMGYGFLTTNNLQLSKDRFLLLINDPKYGNDSRYYYGYIAYKLEDYGIAESTLKKIADNATYKAEITYYLLDISFKAGKFKRCIEMGKKLLPEATKDLQSEISKIIGESYFNLEKYAASIPYLKNYRGKKGKWNNTDYYQLGYAYYKQNDFENAINNFNKIIDQKNNVSQNAYSHLGECYLKVGQKNEALNAFKSASEMSFDVNIQQDAALNYAKLSYEAGNPFEPVSEVLQNYLKKYPKSKAYQEINKLVVSSFINEQNYQGAIDFLSQKKSEENTALIIEVSLYRGIQLFNEEKYKEALPFFSQAKKSTITQVKERAQFWEAEAAYRLENYQEAITKLEALNTSLTSSKNEFKRTDYTIGYAYFKLKKYEKSIVAFKKFLAKDSIDADTKYDAIIRLGDGYFASRNYTEAVKSYKIVADELGPNSDYAQYQIGMSYGFTDDDEAKITALKKVLNDYQNSNLKDDALYQIANTYIKIKDHKNAHIAYNRLLEKYPNSVFLSRALLRQGLLYYNDNMNQQALKKYKEVVARFSNSPEALEAVANARNVYIDEGNLDDYINWMRTLKFVNVSNADIDNTSFAVAEKKYFEANNKNEIVKSLVDYSRKFPDGIHKIKANYYLADVYFKTKQYQSAIIPLKNVIDEGRNEFSEEALSKLSQIYLQNGNYNEALPVLDKLELEANSAENILFAQSNLMKAYFETEAYDFAIEYAKKILQQDKIDTNLKNDAQIIIARSSFKTEDFRTAEEFFNEIEKTASGALKAEALYYNAYFKNQQKEYAASNKVVQKLIAGYANYKYWGVKSYVIMGKNYYGLKDVYQATFVLENVIKNFKEFDDVIQEASKELNTIKENEAKTNNSVNPEKQK